MCAGIVTIYWYFKQTQKTAQTPINKGINLKKIDYNKDQIKDFNYTYFKQGKKCFILKAKEHSLGTDQRSDLKTVDLIVFDEQGKENYTIHAGEGIISNKRDFVLLRAPVEIRNSKGWKVITWLANYYPEEDRMEIRGGPPRISWEEKKAKGRATKINYYPKKDLIELIDKVELSQEKGEDILKISGSYLSINEQENRTIIKGEPAEVSNREDRIIGKEIEIINFAKSQELEEVNVTGEAKLFHKVQELDAQQSLKSLSVQGGKINACFAPAGNMSGWSVAEGVNLNTISADPKDAQEKSSSTINAPYVEGIYNEKGNLTKMISHNGAVFQWVKVPYKINKPVEAQANTITIVFFEGKEQQIDKFLFEGNVLIKSKNGEGKARRVEFDKTEESYDLSGNAQWQTKDLSIKADKIKYNRTRDELSASNDGQKLIETQLFSKEKSLFAGNNSQNSIVLSKILTMSKGEIQFKDKVILTNKSVIIYTDLLKINKTHTQIYAEPVKDLKIMNEKADAASYIIKSEKMNYLKNKGEFDFQGTVEMRTIADNLKISSQKLKAYVDDNNTLKKAFAEENVKLVKNKIAGISKKAEYSIKSNEVILMDSAELVDSDNNKLKGDMLKLNLNDDRIMMAGKGFSRTESTYFKQPETKEKHK